MSAYHVDARNYGNPGPAIHDRSPPMAPLEGGTVVWRLLTCQAWNRKSGASSSSAASCAVVVHGLHSVDASNERHTSNRLGPATGSCSNNTDV